jgi:sugar lactone lactonase YvrE
VIQRIVCALAALTYPAIAATSTSWQVSGFSDFLKGRLAGLSLTADGILQPGPSVRWNTPLEQPALWSLANATDGTIYAATGHSGKIFRISPQGERTVLWSAPQSEVFALCLDTKGVLYAASSPNGGLYRIENGKATEIWHSPGRYIWVINPSPDGNLFVGTGEPGKVYRVDARTGQAEMYFDTGQSNVTALALGGNGHLYAGTDPNGLLYEISAAEHGSILYDSSLPEIRAIILDPNGIVYAAAMGGAVSTRTPAATPPSATSSSAVVASTPTVITITAAKENGIPTDADEAAKTAADQSKTSASSASASATTSNTAITEVSGAEKSAIYRITPDHVIETIRSSTADNVYDLALDGDSLLFSTDDHARIYRLNGRRSTLIAEPGDGETTRLLRNGAGLFAALSNPARLVAFGPVGARPGSYISQVHDSTSVARWGHLRWHGMGSGISFRTRTGNAARPDGTWSAWSNPISDPTNALISSPPARFVQWRAEWPEGSTAQVSDVQIPYLPRNTPPVIRSITVSSIIGTNPAKTGSTAASSATAYSITVTDTGEAPAASSATATSQTVSRLQTTQTQISWQADDPDGDKLVYSVYFRAEDEKEWQLIRSRMFENTLLLDPDVFADGRYFFRVIASDAPSNAAEYAQQTEFISTPVLIDNTPPVVTLGPPRRSGDELDIDVDAVDKSSPLRLCEYSLDAGFWQPIEAVDGVTDMPHEHFHLHLDKLHPGEHLLVFRVYDTANNAGLARVTLR